jgi:hypothetical protein
MSFITNTAYIANKINSLKLKITSEESAEGSVGVPAESFAIAVLKLAIIFIIEIVILQGVVNSSGVMNNTPAPFYSLTVSVRSQITSGYTLASLLVLVVGAAGVMHYLDFI